MIGSFTIYDCSGFEGALAWGVTWIPEGEEPLPPSGSLQMTQGCLFENVGLTGQLSVMYVGGPGVFPDPGFYPDTTIFRPAPFGPFTLEDGKSYCINAQTGVLTETVVSDWITPIIGIALMLGMVAMIIPKMKEGFE